MAEENPQDPPAKPQEDPPGAAPEPAPTPTAEPTPPEPAEPGAAPAEPEGEFDRARAMRTINAQRESEKKLTKELKEVQAKLKAQEDKDLSEAERLKKDNEDLSKKLEGQQQAVRDAALKVAIADSKHKVASVEDTAFLLARAGVEYDDANVPQDVEDKLGTLLEAKPFLKPLGDGRPSGDSDAGKGAGGGKDLDSMTADDHFRATQPSQ